MTTEAFIKLIAEKDTVEVSKALFGLVRAWRYYHEIRMCVYPQRGKWSFWVEYGDEHDLSGHSIVEGVCGEGADVDIALRDCTVRWFVYIQKVNTIRADAVKHVCIEPRTRVPQIVLANWAKFWYQ